MLAEALSKIVKWADTSNPVDLGGSESLLVFLRVYFAVLAVPGLGVVSCAISAIHLVESLVLELCYLQMSAALILLTLSVYSQKVDKPTLTFYQDTFVVRKGKTTVREPLNPVVLPPVPAVVYRRNKVFAVWDDRGLSVHTPKKLTSSKLFDFALSTKVLSKDELLANATKMKSGERTKEASALSGSRRIGRSVYFLVRWEDRNAKPWLEALFEVDLDAEAPEARFVGRFKSISIARKPIDDRLMLVDGQLAIIGTGPEGWSLDRYDPVKKSFDHLHLGEKLNAFAMAAPTKGVFVETTSYGSTVSGFVDLIEHTRTPIAESRGPVRFLDAKSPTILVERRPEGLSLLNAATGALTPLEEDMGVKRVGAYLVLYSPKLQPTHASLLDPASWDVVSQWKR